MRKGIYSICVGLLVTMIPSCKTPLSDNVHTPEGVYYEIFVLAFADGNGDGKGDLPGVTAKLDYVQQLGIKAIWLMPVMPSPSYHKYDVTDYRNIHPHYGTLDDFKKLVDEAHKRQIKVIIDLVLNHTSREHPWFLSAKQDKQSPYRDYYVWADKDSIKDQVSKKTITLDSDNITQWHAVNGDSTAEHYYGFFSDHMPDLNFDNQAVRDEMVSIARFWIEEMNVDGFRFDAAKHIYPDDRAVDNHAFWDWYHKQLTQLKPDVYMVGEVYSVEREAVAPFVTGLPAVFNFELGSSVISMLNRQQDTVGFVDRYIDQTNYFKSFNAGFVDAPILTNHDQNRIMSQLGDDLTKAKLAASILLTLPGTPYVYYGEELGMRGTKPDEFIREPFLWGDPVAAKWMEPKFNTIEEVADLQKQMNDPASLYNHYKTLIAYRNNSKALTSGSIQKLKGIPDTVVGYQRVTGEERAVVLHNISAGDVTIPKAAELKDFIRKGFSTTDQVQITEAGISLPAGATVVLVP